MHDRNVAYNSLSAATSPRMLVAEKDGHSRYSLCGAVERTSVHR